MPRQMLVQHPHLFGDTHVVVLVVEFTLAATRDTIRLLSWLKANAPQARVLVVANKVVNGATEVTRKDFEQSIERKVDIVVPFDPKVASKAAKLGQPLAKVAKVAKIGQPLGQLLKLTIEHAESADDAQQQADAGANSLLGKLGIGSLKTLMAKKPALKAKAV